MSCPSARPYSAHCAALFLALLAVLPASALDPPSETDRLAATGRLWVTVKYFHPYLASRDLDWDQALVEALPKIRSAGTAAEYEAAVHSLLGGLADSVPAVGPATGQRVWVHYGLAPETGEPSSHFYSAFLYKPGTAPEDVSVPMGGFKVTVRLSELASGAAIPTPRPVRIYSDPYPATELRILAAYKIWGVFHYFFAYRDLMDEDWDPLLKQFLPRVIAAKDAQEYNLAIADWLTHTTDSFVTMQSEAISHYFGEAPVGLRLRIVERHVTVTEVLDPAAVKAGVKVGDVVKTVAGQTLVDRYKQLVQYIPASTLQRQGMDVTNRILNGPEDSAAALTIEDNAGNRKELTLKRSKSFLSPLSQGPHGDPLKVLRGGVGYADLRRLERGEVEAMFEKFRHAPAIIFDMRGVPADDSFKTIAARLTSEPDVAAAIVTGPIVATPDLPQGDTASRSSSYFFVRMIENSQQWKYPGKTVMLVDERTCGAGEEAGLFLEAANKTEFVGTPTAGANSLLTNFTVPGGITISLSGQDIRHANGGKLQRLGLQPNVSVAPSLAGIRTGKDEVLEKALDHLLPKLPTAAPARAKISSRAVTAL